MTAVEVVSACAVVAVGAIVVAGARRGGWRSQTGYSEYQRGQEALRAWWRKVIGKNR